MPLSLPAPTAPRPVAAQPCIIARTRDAFDADDQTQIDAWLNDTTVAAWRIGQAITASATAVKDHRGQRCSCYRGKTDAR